MLSILPSLYLSLSISLYVVPEIDGALIEVDAVMVGAVTEVAALTVEAGTQIKT